MILNGVCLIAAFNSNATLGAPLLPSCIEQPEGGMSSVAFFCFLRQQLFCQRN
jgi:hypothetical protein